jgi:hypothetical protein
MDVRDDDRRGIREDRGLEYLTRMDQGRVQRAPADLVIGNDTPLGRQAQDREHF